MRIVAYLKWPPPPVHQKGNFKTLLVNYILNIFSGRAVFPCSPYMVRDFWKELFPEIPHHIFIDILILSVIYTFHARSNSFKYFFPSSVVVWNSLDFDVASMTSLLAFKRALTC